MTAATEDDLPWRGGSVAVVPKRPILDNVQQEQALIGALLIQNQCFSHCEGLKAEHFSEPLHQRIYAAIQALLESHKPANPITVNPMLPQQQEVAGLTTAQYLARLCSEATGTLNVASYVRDTIMLFRARAYDAAGAAMLSDMAHGATAEAAVAEYLADVDAIRVSDGLMRQTIVTVERSAEAFVERTMAIKSGTLEDSIKTGLYDLDSVIGGIHAGELIVGAGRPGQGKEQPIDTPVLTPTGWRQIGTLKCGDLVISREGTTVRVIGVFPQGTKTAYRVTFRDGTSTECGIDHLWLVAPSQGRSRKKFSVKPLKEIIRLPVCRAKKGNRTGAKWRVPLCAPVQFPQADLPIDPYVLGVLIGDGALSGKDLRFSNPDMDSDIRSMMRERLPPNVAMRENRSGACPYFTLRGDGRKEMRGKIAALSLNVKSLQKFIPTDYMMSSVDQRIDLLRGLMDTDGSCSASRNRTSFSTMSEVLAHDMAALVRSLGGLAIVHRSDRTHHDKGIEFTVNVKTDFCPFSTSRKKARWRPQHPSRYIFSVEPSREVEQVCISVEGSLYLTNDYIVTHNSTLAASLARQIAKAGHGVAMFSLEMPQNQTMARILADEAFDDPEFDDRGIRKTSLQYERAVHAAQLSEPELNRLYAASKRLMRVPMLIDYSSRLSMGEIAVRSHGIQVTLQQQLNAELKLIVIDYIKHVQASDRYRGNRVYEVGEISAACKQLAKDTGTTVLLLAQLSRAVEATEDKRPQLQFLRESGDLEADADTVFLLFRQAYYLRADPAFNIAGSAANAEFMSCSNTMEINVAKQRMGRTSWVKLFCDMGCSAVRSTSHGTADSGQPEMQFDGFANR